MKICHFDGIIIINPEVQFPIEYGIKGDSMRRANKSHLLLLTFTALLMSSVTRAQMTEVEQSQKAQLAFSDVERSLSANDLQGAASQFENAISISSPATKAYSELVLWYAGLLSLQGKSYPAIKLLGDCSKMVAPYIAECSRAIEYYNQGNGMTLSAIIAGVRKAQSNDGNVKYSTPALPSRAPMLALEDEEEDSLPRQPSMSPSVAVMTGILAGLSGQGVSAASLAQRAPSPAQRQPNTREPPEHAEHCVSIYPDPGSSAPQFHNTCSYLIQVTWCSEDPQSSSVCRGGINGSSSTNLSARSSWPAGRAKVHFVACKGWSLASLKNGIGTCM